MDWADLPPLSMLRAFDAAARTGGFSAAGRELNVTHAAVAQQVRGLEKRLGLTLMRRDGRGLALTPEGRRLADGLGVGFEAMRAALAAVMAAAEDGPVRVTLTPIFSASWLMPRLGAFREKRPDIELMLNPSAEVIDMSAGDYDLAIRYGAGRWPGLESEKLAATTVTVVATPGLLAAHPVRAPADLLGAPWVQELGQREFEMWLAQLGVVAEGKRSVLHLPGHLALQAVREGQGVGMVARLFVEEELRAGTLVSLFDSGPAADGVGYHLVRRPGRMRPDLAAFVAWLRREGRRDAARRAAETGSAASGPTDAR